MNAELHRPLVLLVEDNPGDIRLVREALRQAGLDVELEAIRDGEAALTRLMDSAQPLPDLILLDLNLPRIDGREVLTRVKKDERLRRVPVIVLTASEAPHDVARCYAARANCYLTKPVNLRDYMKVIRRAFDFWLSDVRLPGKGSDHEH